MKTTSSLIVLIAAGFAVAAPTSPAQTAAMSGTNILSPNFRMPWGTAQTNFVGRRGKTLKGNLGQMALRSDAPGSVVATAVLERGMNHKVVQTVTAQAQADGAIGYQTNSYTELATGMHYQENGEWKETREWIEPFAGGAVARFGPHKVIFAENLNTAGAIDLETPDAKRLRSHVLGLGYLDTASGKSVLIAEVKDCRGQIVGSNQVLYADAFTDTETYFITNTMMAQAGHEAKASLWRLQPTQFWQPC